jgi:hypothetical protein
MSIGTYFCLNVISKLAEKYLGKIHDPNFLIKETGLYLYCGFQLNATASLNPHE